VSASLFVRVLVTVLVILDPIGNVPTFLALTAADPGHRTRAAGQATVVAAAVILAFALFGQAILGVLHISVPAIQVSGGLVLALVALQLLAFTSPEPSAVAGGNPALVPLGTPLLAGPGAIAATMVFIRQAGGTGATLTVVAGLLVAIGIVYVVLRAATLLSRHLRRNVIDLLTRIVGLLLAAIAVQLVALGVQAWVRHGVA
jgi:multiple antibiotic resistance protein